MLLPPSRALRAPVRARATRTPAKVTGTRAEAGGSRMASIGSRAPERKESAEAPAAWRGLGISAGSMCSSVSKCAARAPWALSSTAAYPSGTCHRKVPLGDDYTGDRFVMDLAVETTLRGRHPLDVVTHAPLNNPERATRARQDNLATTRNAGGGRQASVVLLRQRGLRVRDRDLARSTARPLSPSTRDPACSRRGPFHRLRGTRWPMPGQNLCRVGPRGPWRASVSCWVARHSYRFSRKARSLSGGRYRRWAAGVGATRARAFSLRVMSAWM